MCVTVSLCVYEAMPHVGAQRDHVAEVNEFHDMIRAVSDVLQLSGRPNQLLRFIGIAKSLLNNNDNCEFVPRGVNMFRSASHFHPGLCRVLQLLLQPRPPPSDVCSRHVIGFVQAGHSLRADFDELEKGFVDPYTHEEYDLREVLASLGGGDAALFD